MKSGCANANRSRRGYNRIELATASKEMTAEMAEDRRMNENE